MKADNLDIKIRIGDEQIQEIDRHICIIEKTMKMLDGNGTNPLVRETVFGATAKISDILAGENPNEKKPPVLFLELATRKLVKSTCDTLEQLYAHDGYLLVCGELP